MPTNQALKSPQAQKLERLTSILYQQCPDLTKRQCRRRAAFAIASLEELEQTTQQLGTDSYDVLQ